MRGPGFRSASRNKRVAGGLLAAAVAAGTAYAMPPSAQAAPAPAPVPGHHLSTRLGILVSADSAGLSQAATARQLGLPQAGPASILRTPDGLRLVVDIRLSSYDEPVVGALEAAGAQMVIASPQQGSVTMAVLPQDLTAVGDVAGVEYVGEEFTPQVNAVCDATISAGDAILKADTLRATGVDGTGVRVGVLSDSYNKAASVATNAPADIASDNLPGAANTCGHTTVSA
ncbi:MAG TPA: hypothetical protein VFI19_04945, partial [Nocardioides sp.]|nr:hypothetical protein [Nocardioides sp.]